MEEKNKKLFSTILLAVGVLFIVVSGGIFVSQTWQYLPDALKKLCLVLVTGGFFLGSYVANNKSLEKASVAFYYLGICFTGFTVKSLTLLTGAENSLQLCLAMLAMSMPVLLRFWRRRGIVELILQVFLCDGMMLCVLDFAGDNGFNVSLSCLTLFATLMAGMIAYCRAYLPEEKGILATAGISYLFHACLSVPFTLLQVFFGESFLFTVFPVLMLAASVTVLYLSYDKNLIFRIAQSVLLLYTGFAFSVAIFRKTMGYLGDKELSYSLLSAFFIGLILMVWLRRKELLLANTAITVLYTLIQVSVFAVLAGKSQTDLFCHPYGLFMALALLGWKLLSDADLSWLRTAKLSAVFALMNLNAALGFFIGHYADCYVFGAELILLALLIVFIMEDHENTKPLRAIFYTISLFVGEFTIIATPFIPVRFYEHETGRLLVDFSLEHDVIFLGLGIVLLGIIWYDIFEGIRMLQFIGTCLLLATMIVRNLERPAVPNVLFLGIGTLVMLIVATLLKKKNYAIASASALILVVLYLTRAFWLSIAWWVYLFVAGIGLVIFAIKKEKAEK